jgi:hypothetical protein
MPDFLLWVKGINSVRIWQPQSFKISTRMLQLKVALESEMLSTMNPDWTTNDL